MSSVEQAAFRVRDALGTIDTVIVNVEIAARAVSEAHSQLGIAACGTQSSDLIDAVSLLEAAMRQTNTTLQLLRAARDYTQAFLDHLVGQGQLLAQSSSTLSRPAGAPSKPSSIRHKDGSWYSSEALWCLHDLPRRVREGGAGEKTVGYADGELHPFTSGNDGAWTPFIQERLNRIGGIPPRARQQLGAHVEMKVAAMMIHQGRRRSQLVINHVPCGSQPHHRMTGCHQVLERFLPKGYTLTVHGTTQNGVPFSHTYRGQA